MRTLLVPTALALFNNSSFAFAGVAYDEQFAAYYAQYDFPWQSTGSPSRFLDPDYVVGPFDPSQANTQKVYVEGNRVARIGIMVSTIYDLDAATVTVLRRDKNQYVVVTFNEWLELLDTIPLARRTVTSIDETDQPSEVEDQTAKEYIATVFSGPRKSAEIVGHASLWTVSNGPVKQLVDYQKRCLDKYGLADALVCSLTDPRGFGMMTTESFKLDGYTVMEILEVRVPVPEAFHHGPDLSVGPRFARIFRAETKLSNFTKESIDDAVFTVPAHYKRVKRVSAGWLNLKSTYEEP